MTFIQINYKERGPSFIMYYYRINRYTSLYCA